MEAGLRDIKNDTAAIRAALGPPSTAQQSPSQRPPAEEEKELVANARAEKLWFREVEAIYGGNATGREYARYNETFISWFSTKYGKASVTERAVREHIQEASKQGKSTKMMVAALKFRFNFCEGKSFDFRRLIKQSARPQPHQALKKTQLAAIFNTLRPHSLMHLACRMLYDLAARVQDLL